MARARAYRFPNGRYGVQMIYLGFIRRLLTEPDEIGNDVCQTTGMKMVFQRDTLEKVLPVVDNINKAGPIGEKNDG